MNDGFAKQLSQSCKSDRQEEAISHIWILLLACAVGIEPSGTVSMSECPILACVISVIGKARAVLNRRPIYWMCIPSLLQGPGMMYMAFPSTFGLEADYISH